jgi:hypothetical protein
MQGLIDQFTSTVPGQNNPLLGTYFGGKGYDQYYFPAGGAFGKKIPAGYHLLRDSPKNAANSPYVQTPAHWTLTSGGEVARVSTQSTGKVTMDNNMMTNLKPSVVRSLAKGMLILDPTYFAAGTVITNVDPAQDSITLSNNARVNGPAGFGYTFVGTQYSNVAGSPKGDQIENIDPNVGVQLTTGMLVSGPGIKPGTTVTGIAPDYKSVTLSAAATAGGKYTFTGGVADYAVGTITNLWYSWANYYSNTYKNLAPIPATGNTNGVPNQPTNAAGLTLTNLDPSIFTPNLVIGMGVTSSGNDIPAGTTITAIDSVNHTITLSRAATDAIQGDSFTFTAPAQLAASSDVQPFDLSFDATAQPTAIKFAAVVYDTLLAFGNLQSQGVYLSPSEQAVSNVIGCSTGGLEQVIPLPQARVTQLTNEVISLMRGVYSFKDVPQFNPDTNALQWYPDPSVGTSGAFINGSKAMFGVYNLNPFVWFVHVKLHMSGYGFSVDDNISDVGAPGATTLQLAIGGTSGLTKSNVDDQWSGGAPFGVVTGSGMVDSSTNKRIITFNNQPDVFAQLTQPNPDVGLAGALVTGQGVPANTRITFIDLAHNQITLDHDLMPDTTGTFSYTFSGFPLTGH